MRFFFISLCAFFLLSLSASPQERSGFINSSPRSDTNQVWFPLNAGDTYQMFYYYRRSGGFMWPEYVYNVITRTVGLDTLFSNGKKYNYYDGFWLRYDTLANIVYANYNGFDYVYVNFALPEDSTYSRIASPDSSLLQTVKVVTKNVTAFDSTFATKGYLYLKDSPIAGYSTTSALYFFPDIGWIFKKNTSGLPTVGTGIIEISPIEILLNGNYPVKHFSDNAAPDIKSPSLFYPTTSTIQLKIPVTHKFSKKSNDDPYLGQGTTIGYCFVDSVHAQVYLSNGTDTLLIFNDTLQNENEVLFKSPVVSVDALLLSGYNRFLSKFTAKDKGLIPHYDSFPDDGLWSTRLINPYFKNPDAALYPFSDDNIWLYKKFTITPDSGLVFYSCVRSGIIGDTLLSNDKQYKIFRDLDSTVYFDRLDTLSGNIYRAKLLNNIYKELLLDSLSAPLNSSFYAHRFTTDSLVKITRFDSTLRTIAASSNPLHFYTYKEYFGIVEHRKPSASTPGSLGFYYELIAARINGIWCGDSTLLERRDIAPEKITFSLSQNYPNPFNPSTTIRYSIPANGLVTIKLYDVLGNEIALLVNEEKSPGNYKAEFNASKLPSGIYFYRLQAGSSVQTKKMILLK